MLHNLRSVRPNLHYSNHIKNTLTDTNIGTLVHSKPFFINL